MWGGRRKKYEKDEMHEMGEGKEKSKLQSKVEHWFEDQKEVGKEVVHMLEKWLPHARKKEVANSEITSVQESSQGEGVSTYVESDVEATRKKEKQKKHAKRPLLLALDKLQEVLGHRQISHGMWRRAYNDGKILQIGYLEKQGGRIKSWHKRLFLLRSHGLYYFEARRNYVKGEPPRGFFLFKDIIPSKDKKVCHVIHLFLMLGKPHTFSIHSPARTFVISAKTKHDMKRWMNAIEEAYTAFWRRYEIVPPNTEISPSIEGSQMTLQETHEIAEVLDAVDLEEEQNIEVLKKRLYLAKTLTAWKFAVENKLVFKGQVDDEEEEQEEG